MNPLKIGLFGFGCVGQGLYDILESTKTFPAEVVKICVKNANKPRPLPLSHFTWDSAEILDNPEINLVVELIDNADEAYAIVTEAMRRGKNVVTANKKMVAEHLAELVELQQEMGVSFLYEAAVCGSIPIIRNLEEYYDNELLYSVRGIFNGSTNFILTKMYNEGAAYATVLAEAQQLGFAESDPTLDVGGFDPRFKLTIATAHAYGLFLRPDEILALGIQQISAQDIRFAREKGWKIKLVAQVSKLGDDQIAAYLMPQFVAPADPLHKVDEEYNGVVVEAAFSSKQFFYGKGAGGHPTGSAVLSDISATTYGYRYGYKKRDRINGVQLTQDVVLEVYLRYTHESVLNHLKFNHIRERYYGDGLNYVIGSINLQELIRNKARLAESGASVIALG